ncbi:TBC1 domain family member 31-like isoform X2 [Liolophura sinensis]|uniref:TBC1 domain family member 31-like isoform X2 n=1 Tax=Liolophura sinensis TaxID=3198878 RepID=UPI003158A7A2
MSLQVLDVCRKTSGKIWQRKPIPNDDGLMVSITHNISSALPLSARNIRFLQADFDSTGETFIAGDHQGNIFVFDLSRNRFSLVQRTGSPCTALAYKLRRKNELLAGMSDYSLKCYDTESKELVAWMKGHDSAIYHISLHASGRYALTSSSDAAQLWDLDRFERKRKLNINENVGIVKVFFVPLSNLIITCFKDDTIFAWESDTLTCKYQLHAPPGKPPNYREFAATRDGRTLAAGGRSRFVHLWNLDTHQILRIIELPKKVMSVKQLEFLPENFDGGASQILGVVCQDGIVRFISIVSCKLLFDVGSQQQRVSHMTISPNGRHIVCVMTEGNLHVYSACGLYQELNRPPPPLVKVVESNKMSETVSTKSSETPSARSRCSVRKMKSVSASQEGDNSETTDIPEGLDVDRLFAILKGYGEYPVKYRMFIWRSLLRLPENHAAYGALVDKGNHPAYSKIHETYPVKSRKLLRILQRILSALAHWSPIFGETQYLPSLAFPFIKLFQNNHLVCFEMIASVLVNWGAHWFEYFPNPPINILGMIENVLAYHDRDLLQHFVKYKVTSQIYAWPLLESLFSEVLTREEWLSLFDNVFSNHLSFLLMAVVAYATCARGPLLQCRELDDFKYFFHHRNSVDIRHMIKEAYRLWEATPSDIDPKNLLEEYTPLTKGQYPVFNKYPKFIVDYQVQERERIRQEEIDFLRQKQASLSLEKETLMRKNEEEAWYRQQKLLLDAEEKRRMMIQDEEQKLAAQRKRVNAMMREVKLKELKLLDAARRKFLQFQKTQREAELKRLDDEVQRKAQQRDLETEQAVEEAQIRHMELQLQKKMFEQELFRDYADASHQLRTEKDLRRKQEELENCIQQRIKEAEREREQEVRKVLNENLARLCQGTIDAEAQTGTELRQRMEDLDREMKQVQLTKMTRENRRLEEEVQALMIKCQENEEDETRAAGINLVEQRHLAAGCDDRRYRLMEQEITEGFDHTQKLRRNAQILMDGLPGTEQVSDQRRIILNESSVTPSEQGSLSQNWRSMDEKEQELLAEVRRMRHRLATENRTKKPPPVPLDDST